ncbi:B12-binding domain-containing radical SAM protein [bacterium]|nr:B12-binding domain-containing radical SAM protein [bacterium]
MRVLLLNPSERKILQANLPKEIEKVRGKNQPVGLLYIAAAARLVPGVDVRVLDAHALDLDAAGIECHVAAYDPDVVAITCITFNLPDVMENLAAAKKAAPRAKIVIGGLQPYLYPEETFNLPGVDAVFLGEAEESFPAYLRSIDNPAALANVPGIMARAGGEVVSTGFATPIADLDSVPRPAYEALDPALYSSVITDTHPTMLMVTSRGCPFRCHFCSHSVTGKKYRYHSPERIVSDVRHCLDLGYRSILFYDEVLTIKRKRVLELCDRIKDEKLCFEWMARATINTVDEEVLRSMKDAGCSIITFGVESGSERVLKRMNRPIKDPAVIRDMFALTKKVGLRSLAYMMVGNPDETIDDLRASRDFLRQIDPDHVHVSVFVAYPATDFYDEGVAKGLYAQDHWRAFSANPTRPFTVPTWPEAPPADELFGIAKQMYRRHYLRPRKILQHLGGITSFAAIRKRAAYARTLLSRSRPAEA